MHRIQAIRQFKTSSEQKRFFSMENKHFVWILKGELMMINCSQIKNYIRLIGSSMRHVSIGSKECNSFELF